MVILRFGPKRKWQEAQGKYTMKTQNVHIFFFLFNIISVMTSKSMGRSGLVEYTGEMIDSCIILIGRAEGKGPLARTRRRWEGNF
jgi:hypothetical protein